MPMMKSTYAAAAVITFMNAWNAYLWPKAIMTDSKAQTMPMLIVNLASGYTTDYGVLMLGVLFCWISTVEAGYVCFAFLPHILYMYQIKTYPHKIAEIWAMFIQCEYRPYIPFPTNTA